MQRFSVLLMVLGGLGTAALSSAAASAGTVSVSVDGLRNQRGQVCMSVFANGQGFPGNGQKAVQAQCVKASGPVAIAFQNLKPGNYAIALFHDANGNGKLDTNFLGMPTEGFGFSRNPKIGMGAPKFSAAAFAVQGNTAVQIRMKYFL